MPNLLTSDGIILAIPPQGCVLGRGPAEPGEGSVIDLTEVSNARTVSRRHARLGLRDGDWYLMLQAEALNPAWVDDLPLEPQLPRRLTDGARIRLGDVFLTFVAPLERTALPAPNLGLDDAVADLRPEPLTRLTPFFGMLIDDAAWRDAHEYHRAAAALDRRAGHGWGIAQGLQVRTDPATAGGLLVEPGVALDTEGHLVVVPARHAVASPALPEGTHYITLRWTEQQTDPQPAWQGAGEYTRAREGYTLTIEGTYPEPPAIELARVVGPGFMRNAQNLRAAGAAELDLRYRVPLGIRPPRDLLVGSLLAGPQVTAAALPNAAGLQQLVRAIAGTPPFRARPAGAFVAGDRLPPLSLLYFADVRPFSFTDADLAPLRDYLAEGGVLLADGCHPQQSPAFTQAVLNLAARLGRSPQPVLRGHPLLESRHLFPGAPTTPDGAPALSEHEGFVMSEVALGLCWNGGPDTAPLSRTAVRESLELGVNIAAYGRQRRHPFEVLEP